MYRIQDTNNCSPQQSKMYCYKGMTCYQNCPEVTIELLKHRFSNEKDHNCLATIAMNDKQQDTDKDQ